jgi:Uma2 family endonuclease
MLYPLFFVFCSMTTTAHQYTLADYEALPEGAPYQLIAGELVTSPAPKPFHQNSTLRIARQMAAFVEEQDCGVVFISPIDVYLSNEDVYQPDILFIANHHLDMIGETNIQGVPEVIVEVLSSNTRYDTFDKKNVYEACGVREYWLVDTKIAVLMYWKIWWVSMVMNFAYSHEQGMVRAVWTRRLLMVFPLSYRIFLRHTAQNLRTKLYELEFTLLTVKKL